MGILSKVLHGDVPPPPPSKSNSLRVSSTFCGALEASRDRTRIQNVFLFQNRVNQRHPNVDQLFPTLFCTSAFEIVLVTVLDVILTSRQPREKLQCLYNENLMSNDFRKTAVLKKYELLTKATQQRILLTNFGGRNSP